MSGRRKPKKPKPSHGEPWEALEGLELARVQVPLGTRLINKTFKWTFIALDETCQFWDRRPWRKSGPEE